MNKIKLGLMVVVGVAFALVVMTGCQRTRYEMGRKIGEPKDAPKYTEKANFQPPASESVH